MSSLPGMCTTKMRWYAVLGVLLIPGCVGQTNPTYASIRQRVTALENLVASLQTQSTSREQKYAALISNILAKLSTNTDEIHNLKSINDHLIQARNATLKTLAQTQTHLGTVLKEFSDLKLEQDKCSRRSLKLKSMINMTRKDVLDVQSNMTDVQLQLQEVLLSVHGPTANVSKVAEISSKIHNLVTSFNQSEAKLNLFLTRINANSQDIASSRANITKLENDMTTSHASIGTKFVDLTKYIHNITHDAKTALVTAEIANRKISNTNHDIIGSVSKTLSSTSLLVHNLSTGYTSLRKTVNSLKSSSQSNSYYFKILLQHDFHPKDGAAIKFSVAPGSVTGSGYSSSTGKFTAPVSGTYVFWADILASNGGTGHMSIMKNGVAFAKGQIGQRVANSIISVLGVTPLKKGQQVWFMKDATRQILFKGNGKSSYGGVILHSD